MKQIYLIAIVIVLASLTSKAQLSAGFFTVGATSNSASTSSYTWNLSNPGSWGFLINFPPDSVTHQLHFTNFGFNIPSASVIMGVETILTYCVMPSGTGNAILKDSIVQLVNNNNLIGNNLGGVHNFTPIVTSYTYGGPSTTWGATLSAADVNGANFGFVSLLKSVGTASAFIGIEKSQAQSAKMKIYYESTVGVPESQIAYAHSYYYNRVVTIKQADENSLFEIFDLTGRRVYQTRLQKNQQSVELNHLTPGVYFYKLLINNKAVYKKFSFD